MPQEGAQLPSSFGASVCKITRHYSPHLLLLELTDVSFTPLNEVFSHYFFQLIVRPLQDCPEDLPQHLMGFLRHPRQSHALRHREELVDQPVLCSGIYNHQARRVFAITVWCRASSHQIFRAGCRMISHAVLQIHLVFKSLPPASNFLICL